MVGNPPGARQGRDETWRRGAGWGSKNTLCFKFTKKQQQDDRVIRNYEAKT